MNPKHAQRLERTVCKLGLMDYRQIFDFFSGEIRARSVNQCIQNLIRKNVLSSSRSSLCKHTLYTHRSEASPGFPDGSLAKQYYQAPTELQHRLSCNDVYIALARRAFISDITTEHELKSLDIENPVLGRNPDGLFTLLRSNRQPIQVAIEVETSLRTRKRIKDVIQRYVSTYDDNPVGLRGALVVATRPDIAGAYREAILEVGGQYPKRFILSEYSDLHDVKDTVFGEVCSPLSGNTYEPLLKSASTCTSKPLKYELTFSPPNIGHIQGNTDRDEMNGNEE
jgi:hypothetical protein